MQYQRSAALADPASATRTSSGPSHRGAMSRRPAILYVNSAVLSLSYKNRSIIIVIIIVDRSQRLTFNALSNRLQYIQTFIAYLLSKFGHAILSLDYGFSQNV